MITSRGAHQVEDSIKAQLYEEDPHGSEVGFKTLWEVGATLESIPS